MKYRMKAKESKLSTRRSSLIMKYQRREPEWERTRLRVACSQFWRFSSSTPGWQAYSSEFVNYDKPAQPGRLAQPRKLASARAGGNYGERLITSLMNGPINNNNNNNDNNGE